MRITPNVVADLLPAYLSGEASADTRALVDALANENPEIARLVASARLESSGEMLREPVALPPDLERDTVERTRKLLRRRGWTLGLALFFTFLPFSFVATSSGINFLMFRDEPGSRLFWLSAAYLWFEYVRLGRRVRA